jgi:PAS domain S-box-containing protein
MPTPALEAALQSTNCPAFVTNGRGRIAGMNGAAETLLGYESASVCGRRCHEVFAGRDPFGNRFCLGVCSVRAMTLRGEAVNPFDVSLKTARGTMIDTRVSVVAMGGTGRCPAGALHLLGPSVSATRKAALGRGGAPRDALLVASGNGCSAPRESAQPTLTRREAEVLSLMAAGKSCHDIAASCYISLVTVRNHLKRIFPKLRVHSQAEAVSYAFRNGMV